MEAEPVEFTPIEDGCQPVQASWEKTTINEGESVMFFINLSEKCKEIPQGELYVSWGINLWEKTSGGRENNRCGNFVNFNRNMAKNRIEGTCNFNNVTNFLEDQPEEFIMAGNTSYDVGYIEIKNQGRYYLAGKPIIKVKDNQ